MRHQLFAKRVIGAVAALCFGCVACGDDDVAATADAARIDATANIDASTVDSTPPDASQPDAMCGADVFFTGDYTDFDSTDISFMGIPDSTWVEVANAGNMHTTPPNGRVAMCLDAGSDKELRATQSMYLPLNVSVSSAALQLGALFSARGIKPARLTQLFSDLSLGTPDSGRAQLMVEVRNHPSGTALVGTTVAIGNTNDGAFTQNSSATYVSGGTITDGTYVFFADVEVSGGTTTVTVTPPSGTCTGRTSVVLRAGELSFTSFACQ